MAKSIIQHSDGDLFMRQRINDILEKGLSILPRVSLENKSKLPKISGIYFAIDSKNTIQYIGQSLNIKKRWQNHHRINYLENLGEVYVSWVDIPENFLREIEKELIEHFKPLINNSFVGNSIEDVAVIKVKNNKICFSKKDNYWRLASSNLSIDLELYAVNNSEVIFAICSDDPTKAYFYYLGDDFDEKLKYYGFLDYDGNIGLSKTTKSIYQYSVESSDGEDITDENVVYGELIYSLPLYKLSSLLNTISQIDYENLDPLDCFLLKEFEKSNCLSQRLASLLLVGSNKISILSGTLQLSGKRGKELFPFQQIASIKKHGSGSSPS